MASNISSPRYLPVLVVSLSLAIFFFKNAEGRLPEEGLPYLLVAGVDVLKHIREKPASRPAAEGARS